MITSVRSIYIAFAQIARKIRASAAFYEIVDNKRCAAEARPPDSGYLAIIFTWMGNPADREATSLGLTGALASARDGFARFLVGCPPTLGFAFVPLLLSASERQLDFDPTVFEVHAGGNQRQAFLLRF